MKKILLGLVAMLLFVPTTLFAAEKVKVYMFESGGCPYCEAELEYLKGLDGYKKTFEVIRKELYVDHIDWEPGKDYDLGVEVANAFNEQGYEDASYSGTPFVVISDIYAAATYSEDLEQYIKQAIEEGDRDAVSCIEDGGYDCIRPNESAIAGDVAEASENAGIILAVVGGVAFIVLIVYILRNKMKEEVEEKEEKVKEEKTKKTATKKTTNKNKKETKKK